MNQLNNNRGFYIVLALCITAISVTGYVNFSNKTDTEPQVVNQHIIIDDAKLENVTLPEDTTKNVVNEVSQVEKEPVIIEQPPIVEEVIEKEIEQTPVSSQTVQTEAIVTVAPSVEITKNEPIFVKPCDGAVILGNSLDALIKNESMNDWRTHNATDYFVSVGQDIFAITDGEVISIQTDDQFGTIIEIEHANGLITRTCGLNSKTIAKIGDKVCAGDVIGTAIGSFPAEISLADHIHIEATVNGENIDIETLF